MTGGRSEVLRLLCKEGGEGLKEGGIFVLRQPLYKSYLEKSGNVSAIYMLRFWWIGGAIVKKFGMAV